MLTPKQGIASSTVRRSPVSLRCTVTVNLTGNTVRIVLPVMAELKDPGAPASSQTLGRYPSSRSTDSVQPSRHILDYQIASAQILSSLTALAASASAVEDDSYNVDPSSSRGAPKTREQLS